MKARLTFARTFIVILVGCLGGTNILWAAEAVIDRGPHHKRVKDGTRSWVEMATGLSRRSEDGTTWADSNPTIEVFQNGNLGRQTAHQVLLAADAADPAGAVDILWPDGKRFRTRTTGLAYYSRLTDQSLMFAEIQSAVSETAGTITAWEDCFEGASCDLIARQDRAGVECDVVVRRQLVDPAQVGFGANDDSILLQVWHEILDPMPARTVRYVAVREQDPVKRALYAAPDITDDHLDWGSFFIGPGRCFVLGNENNAAMESIPVYKHMGEAADGTWWLVESVQLSAVRPLLQTLPLADANTKQEQQKYWAGKKPVGKEQMMAGLAQRGGNREINAKAQRREGANKEAQGELRPTGDVGRLSRSVRPTGTKGFAGRVEGLGKKKEVVTAGLDWNRRPGVVLDYVTLSAGSTNGIVFQSDTTYYISGTLNVGGSGNRLEPGTVLKMAKTNTAQINVTGYGAKLTSQGNAFNLATITSIDDNTIGETLPGSDGIPGQDYERGINFDYTSSSVVANLSHIRVRHAKYGIRFMSGTGHVLSHAQLVGCMVAFYLSASDCSLRNVLLYDCGTAFYGDLLCNVRSENVTLHKITSNVNYMGQPPLFFTNSLIVGVTNSYGTSYQGTHNTVAGPNDGTFEPQVGASMNYLVTVGSTNRNSGTTNINAQLLKELRQLTTFAPTVLTNAIVLDTVLAPLVQRDLGDVDRGYHFSPIDYAVSDLAVTNATLMLTGGVSVATFGSTGIWLQDNSTLISQGLPLRRNQIVHYKNVYELSTNWGAAGGATAINPYNWGNAPPTARLRWTDFSASAYGGNHLYGDGGSWKYNTLVVRDCEFNTGFAALSGATTTKIALTNNLFHRTALSFESSATLSAFNNLFRGGSFYVDKTTTTETIWTLRDNSFDNVSMDDFGNETTNSHNAYINTTRLNPGTAASDIVLSSFTYDTNWLSRWYHTTSSTLWNAGSLTNAGLAGLYHFSTRTNLSAIETNTIVDIGYHMPGITSITSSGTLNDADGDGIGNVIEDVDGDGVFDSGTSETDWLSYDSMFGVGSGPGLVVFTPLK